MNWKLKKDNNAYVVHGFDTLVTAIVLEDNSVILRYKTGSDFRKFTCTKDDISTKIDMMENNINSYYMNQSSSNKDDLHSKLTEIKDLISCDLNKSEVSSCDSVKSNEETFNASTESITWLFEENSPNISAQKNDILIFDKSIAKTNMLPWNYMKEGGGFGDYLWETLPGLSEATLDIFKQISPHMRLSLFGSKDLSKDPSKNPSKDPLNNQIKANANKSEYEMRRRHSTGHKFHWHNNW